MPTIIKVKRNNTTYLYHQIRSYRDKNGKPQNERKCVGKIDPLSGALVFHKWFLDQMKTAGTPLPEDKNAPKFSINDIKNSRTAEFGLLDVLRQNAERLGLTEVLRKSNLKYADELFMLASHLVASGEPFIHTQEWLKNSDVTEPIGSLSSQQISRILADISQDDRDNFFREWANLRSEREFLALDITSTSSYSTLIEDVEWGYNRDGESLPQVNLCLLMGESSRLPVYQTTYAGSLKDVSTLKTTLAKFDAITDCKPIMTVMDKGFYSKKNIDALLAENKQFIIAVPFTAAFAKELIVQNSATIEDVNNAMMLANTTLRAVTRHEKWGKFKVSMHVYYNPVKAVIDGEKIVAKVTQMRMAAELDPEKYLVNKEYLRYLLFTRTASGYSVEVNRQMVAEAKKHAGWLVIISNHIYDATEALRIYRDKDVVEKGFLKLKQSIDLGRLRVHSDEAMQNKLFVGFIALILMSHIHTVMCNHNLYKSSTMKQLLRILAKRRVHIIGGSRIVTNATKEQRQIYTAFGLISDV